MRGYLKIIRLGCAVLFCICMLLFCISNTSPLSMRRKGLTGNPYRFQSQREYFGPITDYAVSGEFLYVLYGTKSILNCYRLDGGYSHSFCFEYFEKGRIELELTDECIILKDRNNNLYKILNGEIVGFLDYLKDHDAVQFIRNTFKTEDDKRTAYDGSVYQLHGTSIYRVSSENRAFPIIERPIWTILFNPVPIWMIGFVSFILFAVGSLGFVKRSE